MVFIVITVSFFLARQCLNKSSRKKRRERRRSLKGEAYDCPDKLSKNDPVWKNDDKLYLPCREELPWLHTPAGVFFVIGNFLIGHIFYWSFHLQESFFLLLVIFFIGHCTCRRVRALPRMLLITPSPTSHPPGCALKQTLCGQTVLETKCNQCWQKQTRLKSSPQTRY